MSHATVRPSRASPNPAAQRASGQRDRPTGHISDVALASATERAVREVAGVTDLSPGLATPVATYGPGQRVTGIAIHHPAAEEVIFEVHVILSEAHCIMGSADADADADADAKDDAPAHD